MKDRTILNPSRRNALRLATVGLATIGAPAVLNYARAQSKRIVVRDDGGVYTTAYGACFYRPFTEKTGIEVIGVQANAEPIAQIRSMVAYRTDAFKGRKAPNSWADFWNVKDFPGRRSLRKHPFDTIEESLMAAGVPTASLYPLNVDQAFANLDKISPSIDVWWNSGAQVTQMLTSGEVDMIATWVSRPQNAMIDGAPVAISWNQNLWGVDNWSILAGTPNADACREFIKFASDPKRMAQQTEYYPAGVTQPEAFKYIKPEVAKNCPTYPDNIKNGVQINAKYWLDNQAAVTERFNSWILK